ncbi:MAG: YdeI/OmpD-associated family protein [Thermomicrobiales bacterium]
MKNVADVPILSFETPREWEAWLEEHHSDAPGIWLKMAKKETGMPSVTYAEALESALCYGWIDGQKASFDGGYWLQRFTPRRPKSIWSRINRDRATALIADGRMRPAGLRQVDLAKSDGRWESAYESQRTITVPDDFARALAEEPKARDFFDTLNSANRYAILFRIHTAKKPETRAARIKTCITMLANGEKFHP